MRKPQTYRWQPGAASDSEIDAISGATITTKAVTNAVNGSLLAFNDYVQGGAGNE